MDDLINRQAAIDAVCKACQYDKEDYTDCPDRNPSSLFCDYMNALRSLPSARPEIVQCKDCKHWRINYYQDVETCFEHRNVDGTEQATRPEDY